MQQDSSRDSLPAGVLWNCVDLIPQYLGAPARKRGGWAYSSTALGSCSYTQGIIYAPFAAGALNLVIGSDNNVYKFTSGSNTNVGAAFPIAQNPIYHRSGTPGLVVIPAASGTNNPKSYDGTTFKDLATTVPQGMFASVWNDRTLLANGFDSVSSAQQPQRLWFSGVGDATSWDLKNAWEDTKLAIVGLAVISTGILIFHLRNTDILTGTTSPSATTIGDLTLRSPVFDAGCIDAQSIVTYNNTAIWADARGVYQSDGNTIKSLTSIYGMQSYWTSLISGYTSGWHISAGIYHDTYIVSIMNGSTFVDCLAFDLTWLIWYRLANVPVRGFARQGSTFEETYIALGNAGKVGALSTILAPTAAVKNDADGTAVQPYYETGLFRGWQHWHRKWIPSMAIQSWRRAYKNYELVDAGTDGPVITMSYATDMSATSYTALTPTFGETTAYARQHRDIFVQGSGIMFKVAQTGPSADTRMHAIEVEYMPLETSRLAQ